MIAERLKVNYLAAPLGLGTPEPEFMWQCLGGVKQTAYRITASVGGETVWDTGKVLSSQMTHIPYKGRHLTSRDRVEWSVRLWDENDMPGECSGSVFELGLLLPEDWQAKWISGSYRVNKKQRYPVDCFRKSFTLSEDIVAARLYATACGLYEGCLNGRRIGNFVLAPGYTDYRKRVQYQTYDVTELLQRGENTLDFQLADGWFRGSVGAWGLRNEYGTQTMLMAQLELTRADGSRMTIITDGTWQWSNDGPIRFADNKDGEIIDASMEPGYGGRAQEAAWHVVPTASDNVALCEHEHFSPTLLKTPSGKTVLDFGQNIAGYISFDITAKKGSMLKLRFGEMLDKQGEFTQVNIQCRNKKKVTPLQQVEYICREGENHYKTRFAIFGFQYVLVEGDVSFEASDFTAIAVYSDMELTADFDSSNELLNRFYRATVWSARNNAADVPTDCPTRERHGWTGDAQIFFNTAAYLLDYATFSRKYLNDVFDWQRKDGCLPQIAPYGGVDFYMQTLNGSVGWSDVGILIPWRFYLIYGDKSILTEYYDRMKRYADFMAARCGKWLSLLMVYARPTGVKGKARKHIVNYGQSYGEWAEPTDVHPMKWYDIVSPHPEVSTAYTSYVLGIMAQIAETVGNRADAKRYAGISDACRESYRVLVRTKNFSLDTDRQAQLVRPLYMGLLDPEQTAYAKQRLLKALEDYGWRLGTGFLSTPLILYVLSDIDPEAAYRLLENEEMPGWLYMPKMGATTIWESWEGTEAQGGIASLDHYSKGACMEWVFSVMCGVQIAGENRYRIAPVPGGSFTHASFSYRSIYGTVSVSWKKQGEGYSYEISIPANCTAELVLPGEEKRELTAGRYSC